MNQNELHDLMLSYPPKWRSRKIKKDKEALELLNELYPNVDKLTDKIYYFLNNKSPFCIICNAILNDCRKATCSLVCRDKNIDQLQRMSKQKKTLLDRYGVDNIRKVPGAKENRNLSMIEKYGKLASPKMIKNAVERSSLLNIKGRKTLLSRYGVSNPGELPDHYDKCVKTMLNTIGTTHFTKTEKYINEAELKKLSNYSRLCPKTITIHKIHPPEKELLETYYNPNYRIEFHCDNCNNTEIIPSETFKFRLRSSNTCCSKCSGITSGSVKERELRDYISNELGLVIISNDRSVLGNKEIDIMIPSLHTGIEFDGLYWHNDQLIDKNYHLNKTSLANSKGIRLIHIFEDEWEHKKEIVKSRLKYLLKASHDIRIHARKCYIKEVSTKEEKQFLLDNHIQGYAPSNFKIGLYHEDALVSLMTFSKPSISKRQKKEENTWELLRFCSAKNTLVAGAASKLFYYFIKTYNPNKIISFCDRRWGEGNVYLTLGFSEIGNTRPNYWYIDLSNLRRIHRFSMRKNKEDSPALTEYENRKKQGYLRIWDCGSSKWIWKRAD